MPILTLRQHLDLTREELLIYSPDFVYRDGYTGDPENASNPTSISLTNKINQAIADILIATHFNSVITTISTVIGTAEYALPAGHFSIESVWIGSYRLRKTTIEEQDRRNWKWRADSGTPKMYYTPSMTTMGFIPNPSSVMTVNVLLNQDVSLLADVADTLTSLPGPHQYLIHIRAAQLCAEIDTGNDKAVARAGYLAKRYAEGLAALKSEIGDRYKDDDDAPLTLPRRANSALQGDTGGTDA